MTGYRQQTTLLYDVCPVTTAVNNTRQSQISCPLMSHYCLPVLFVGSYSFQSVMPQALYTRMWGYTAIILCRPSQALSDWMSGGAVWAHSWAFLEMDWIGLESGLRLDSLYVTPVLVVCLESLNLWKVNLWPSLPSWMLHWDAPHPNSLPFH